MINYEIPDNIREKIKYASKDLESLDKNENVITIFPDYISKRTNTIASGVVIKSKDSIYPCAVPDLGCSFHVIELEGIKREDFFSKPDFFDELDLFLSGKTKDIFFTDDNFGFVEEMMRTGHESTAYLFDEERIQNYENNGKYYISNDTKLNPAIYPSRDSIAEFNKYQGHFLEILVPSNSESNKTYILIHSGSSVLADRLMLHYYPMFAKLSYQKHWSSKEETIAGKFRILLNSGYEEEYYNDVKSILNFTVAYRDIVENKIVKLIREKYCKDIKTTLLSDYSHTKIQITESGVTHQRGIQFLDSGCGNTYLMSGFYGVKSMLFTVEESGFFSHGSQSNLEYVDDTMKAANELIARDFLNGKITDKTVDYARLAKVCYDYCLSQKTKCVDYLCPIYSYKIG